MRDWRAYVQSQLPPLACSSDREREIVDEIAEQLQDIYDGARREGASDADADARARADVADWPGLASDLLAAEHPISASPRRFVANVVTPVARRRRLGLLLFEVPSLVRHAIRTLRTQPLFTTTTIATFALGIGATTLVYALVQTVLIAPLPYREPQQLAFVQQVVPEIAERYPVLGVNPRSFIAYQASCRTTCEAMAAIASHRATLTGQGEPAGLTGARITPNLFAVLGVTLERGRPFDEAEATPGRDDVVILAHPLWQSRFAGDPNVVGRKIDLDGRPVEVIAVLPESFRLPATTSPGSSVTRPSTSGRWRGLPPSVPPGANTATR